MDSSAVLMRKVDRELMLGGALWFLWGISIAVGKWLDIETLKTDKTGALLWFGFAGLLTLGFFIQMCTNAVLAAIRESVSSDEL
jgi:hypothetical protein